MTCAKSVAYIAQTMIEQFFQLEKGINIDLPFADKKTALFFFQKNLAAFTWNTLRLLENNPTNLPDTRVILNGHTVAGLAIGDLLQVKRFGDAAKLLISMLESGEFALDLEMALRLHAILGREEALKWGCLRDSQVFVGNCNYIPPDAALLEKLMREGLQELAAIGNIVARFMAAFAFLAKIQPFFDANKRTAILLANGILLENGIYPLFAPAALEQEMAHAIDALYEDGSLRQLAAVFEKSCLQFYPPGVNYGARWQGPG